MEIIVIALVVVVAGYLIFRPKKSETIAEAVPYKVEAPVVESAPAAPAKAKKTTTKKAPAAKKTTAAKTPRAKKTKTK